MAVALDVAGVSQKTTSTVTSFNYTGITVGSGSNRGLVVVAMFNSAITSPTATWDSGGTNQAMTLLQLQSTNRIIAIFGLAAPTSGAKTLAFAWTTGSNIDACAIAFTGVDQTGGTTSFPHSAVNSGTTSPSSVTIVSAAANAVVAAHGCAGGSAITFTAVNNTQLVIDNAWNSSGALNFGGNYLIGGSASVAMTATESANNAWGAAGTDVLAAAVTFVPYNNYFQQMIAQ